MALQTSLEEKVHRLLDLLDEVEANPAAIGKQLGLRLHDRLRDVTKILRETYLEDEDEDHAEEESLSQSQVANAQLSSQPIEVLSSPSPEPPPSAAALPPTPEVKLEVSQPPSPPSNSQQSYSEMYHESVVCPPRSTEDADEPTRKRRRQEAQAIVKAVEKPKTFSCGCGYQDGPSELDFSNKAKKQIKEALPALKTNKHVYHYMVFATLDRLNCIHCQKCPNSPLPEMPQ